jgi:hypothetical protein
MREIRAANRIGAPALLVCRRPGISQRMLFELESAVPLKKKELPKAVYINAEELQLHLPTPGATLLPLLLVTAFLLRFRMWN